MRAFRPEIHWLVARSEVIDHFSQPGFQPDPFARRVHLPLASQHPIAAAAEFPCHRTQPRT